MFSWLQNFADWLVYTALGILPTSHLGEALHFFVYDSLKILVLLTLIVFSMGIVNSYFPVERVRNFLSRNKLYGLEYLMASLFGVVTPFCSCSSVPLFIGFVKGGIPLGVTFAFLVTSPLVNEVAIGMFVGMFGLKITLIYVISGIVLGTVSGVFLQKMRLEPLLSPWVKDILAKSEMESERFQQEHTSFRDRLPLVWEETQSILKSVLPYVLIGIGIGAAMHGYVPDGFFEKYMQKDNLFAVPIATVLAVPLYANAAGIIPVVQVLVAKGIPIGTAIAFMMATVGLSFPEAVLLKKVMTTKLVLIFFSVVTLCIILSGYLFNMIL